MDNSDDEVLYDDDDFADDDDIPMESNERQENQTTADGDDEYYPFEILSTEQIVQHMLDSIEEVNSVVEIPSTTARILLHHFKWDKQRLMESYFDGPEKLFTEARVVDPFKNINNNNNNSSSSTARDCEICFAVAPGSTLTGLKCGHSFCTACWNDYLRTKITEGFAHKITCAAHDCEVLVDDATVSKLVKDPKVKLKYQQLITNSFVECSKYLRWCPTANCDRAARVRSVEAPRPVTCSGCDCVFCFGCGADWHEPISCSMLRQWLRQCQEDSDTSKWMASNTKDCPKCATNIEKNGGCNYVVCRNCCQQFCWTCRHPTVNYSAHKCRVYSATEPSKEVLSRYLFYYDRHMSHSDSLKLECKLYAKVSEKMEEMQRQDMTWIEVQFLRRAVDALRRCRRTLMYTYAFAFYLEKSCNQTAIFEDNQRDLEVAVETLSGYLERDIADQEDLAGIKLKVQDMLPYCEARRMALLAHVREGNEKDWWEYIKL